MIRVFSLVLLAFSATTAPAEEADCFDTAMTQTDINICSASKNVAASETLDRLIAELKDVLPSEPERFLAKSQEAWEKVVENDCGIAAWYVDGGSARPMVVSSCYASHTRNRIDELMLYLCSPMIATCEAKIKYEKSL